MRETVVHFRCAREDCKVVAVAEHAPGRGGGARWPLGWRRITVRSRSASRALTLCPGCASELPAFAHVPDGDLAEEDKRVEAITLSREQAEAEARVLEQIERPREGEYGIG